MVKVASSLPGPGMMSISMTRRHLEENLQLGIFPDNINGNRKLVLSLTGRALLQIFTHKLFQPREQSPFLDLSWPASHSLTPIDFSVNVLAANLLFRYPIWATPEMPQGRWYPYVGAGLGAQRATLSTSGFQETSYSPAVQGLIGAKFFLVKNLAIFAEIKRTTGWNKFEYEGAGAPPGYFEKYTISSNHLVVGVALHF